jgi:hypothetical protein
MKKRDEPFPTNGFRIDRIDLDEEYAKIEWFPNSSQEKAQVGLNFPDCLIFRP